VTKESIADSAAKGKGHGTSGAREERGIELFQSRGREIDWSIDGTFSVPGTEEGVTYDVDLRVGETGVCTCRDFQARRNTCKHIYAATMKQAQILARKREEAAERKRRAEARSRERITFSRDQILANLERFGA
jgi:hypothetical protein